MSRLRTALAIGLTTALTATVAAAAPRRPPNIIILYADDLGYGDTGAYGAKRIATPNVDALARRGLRFTDGYATAATCTPSRYSLLTGEYGFRSNAEILPGDAPALIRPGQPTIATVLKSRGYATAVVGKWHLGLGTGRVDWNGEVAATPNDIGFDYSFLMPATADRVPTVYLENRRVVGLDPSDPITVSYQGKVGDRPVGRERPDLVRYRSDDQHSDSIVNRIARIGFMAGGRTAEWVDETVHQVLTDKAKAFIAANRRRPFFLYFPMPQPHVPRAPGQRFAGATTMGPRGDAIVEMDWMVGQIMAELKRQRLERDTLVILSSDNGPVLNDGYDDGAVERLGDHTPAGTLRGGKYSAFEAGTRVPLITAWPGTIRPGVSRALVSQVDFHASLGRLAGAAVASDAAIDSRDLSAALLGRDSQGRDTLFTESVPTVAIRVGTLKYIAPAAKPATATFITGKGIEPGTSRTAQLYDLAADPGERRNLAAERPADTARLAAALAREQGRRTANRAARQ